MLLYSIHFLSGLLRETVGKIMTDQNKEQLNDSQC